MSKRPATFEQLLGPRQLHDFNIQILQQHLTELESEFERNATQFEDTEGEKKNESLEKIIQASRSYHAASKAIVKQIQEQNTLLQKQLSDYIKGEYSQDKKN